MKICETCGKEFKPRRKEQRYCSRKCYNSRRKMYPPKKKAIKRTKRIPKRKKMNEIDRIAVAARQAGMSYGQYVGIYEYQQKRVI